MRRILVALTATAVALAGLTTPVAAAPAPPDPRRVKAGWVRVASGLNEPVTLTHPDGDARLFVVERIGRIRIVKNGALLATPFLDVSALVDTTGVGGLLSIAFRPDYRTSGLFFVAYVDSTRNLRVRRYHATPSSDVAEPAGTEVIAIPYPHASYHYGGQIAFGPAGFLFIGTGDGSPIDVWGDQDDNAQNLASPLGKILRIDVNHTTATAEYTVPSNNPFLASPGAVPEIWLVGFRNPWRFSFDRGHPDLWVGDVGENDREEIDKISTGGLNLGWDCREGTLDTSPGHTPEYGGSYCSTGQFTPPVHEYPHSAGCAIMGGYVYRGTTYASLAGGEYLYGDYCNGKLWLLGKDAYGRTVAGGVNKFPRLILGFGRDQAGELYLVADDGGVYHITFLRR
jgi:glucose/arabinose dehydrogenase